MEHYPSPLTLFGDLFVPHDVFNIRIMPEYAWFIRKIEEGVGAGGGAGGGRSGTVFTTRENITPAGNVLTVPQRANTAPVSPWSYPKRPLIHRLTYSPASVQQQTLQGEQTPSYPFHCHPALPIVSLH